MKDPAAAETIVCDLDGVVYLEDSPIPGVSEAMARLVAGGRRLVFVTNNASRTTRDTALKIHQLAGHRPDSADVITSGTATARWLRERFDRVFCVGAPGLAETLADGGLDVVADWREAEAVVTGLNRDLTYDLLSDATLAIRQGAVLVATNDDPTYPTPEGSKPGAGAIVAALERAGEQKAIVCGKPHEPIREAVRGRVGKGPALIVGDRPDTDLAMGIAEGWTTVLVLTGATGDPSQVDPRFEPDVVLGSFAELPSLLDG